MYLTNTRLLIEEPGIMLEKEKTRFFIFWGRETGSMKSKEYEEK